jgi:hypothetical protein
MICVAPAAIRAVRDSDPAIVPLVRRLLRRRATPMH